MAFSTFPMLHDHQLYLTLKFFHLSNSKILSYEAVSPTPSSLQPPGNQQWYSAFMVMFLHFASTDVLQFLCFLRGFD